jgi:hypothetical protein
MKNFLIFAFIITSAISFAQSTIATTESGRRVLLKKNNTWEYIDSETIKDTKTVVVAEKECDLKEDVVKKPNERLRKHAAVENDCKPEEVKFIAMSQQIGGGTYSLCCKGKIVKYKKIGTVFMKADQSVF